MIDIHITYLICDLAKTTGAIAHEVFFTRDSYTIFHLMRALTFIYHLYGRDRCRYDTPSDGAILYILCHIKYMAVSRNRKVRPVDNHLPSDSEMWYIAARD